MPLESITKYIIEMKSYRDSLLASLTDGVRALGNADVHVKMTYTNRGLRLGPFLVPMDEEIESSHLKFRHLCTLGGTQRYLCTTTEPLQERVLTYERRV